MKVNTIVTTMTFVFVILTIFSFSGFGYGVEVEKNNMSVQISVLRLTNDTKYQHDPVIFDDIVCWEGESSIGMYYDLLSHNVTFFGEPGGYQDYDIYGNYIVWEDYRNGNSPKIYYYDIKNKTENRVSYRNSSQYIPSIYKNYIVWLDEYNGNLGICLHNIISNETLVLYNGTGSPTNPDIWGDYVVWEAYVDKNDSNIILSRPDLKYGIYIHNLHDNSTFVIKGSHPMISGDFVAGEDDTGVFIYSISTGKRLHISSGRLYGLSGDFVLWYGGGQWIYSISRNKSYKLPLSHVMDEPCIWDNRIVYVHDGDIYLLEFHFTDNTTGESSSGDSSVGGQGQDHGQGVIPFPGVSGFVFAVGVAVLYYVRHRSG